MTTFGLRLGSVLAIGALMAACTSHRPAVDPTTSANPAAYESDLAECQQIASQNNAAGETVLGTLGGAAVGAALGAAVGAIAGAPATGAATGAAVGGIGTGAAVGVTASQEQKTIIDNCMRGRGHNVLN
ncbi:MAG: hypothetical protein ACPGOY_17460 [Rhodospirillaceae bacterium]